MIEVGGPPDERDDPVPASRLTFRLRPAGCLEGYPLLGVGKLAFLSICFGLQIFAFVREFRLPQDASFTDNRLSNGK